MSATFPKTSNHRFSMANATYEIDHHRVYARYGKRIFDLAFVVLTAPLVLPLILLLAFLTMLDGANPFFVQNRIGRGGRCFKILKLRTMVPDAESRLDEHLSVDPEAAAEWHLNQKLRSDPRVTFVGRLLRKTSLDELPQFWNVLRGDMSIVGPRPMMENQRALYPGQAYYALRPGITGPWQVSSRNESEFAGRARYDADYAAHLSFATDLRIVFKTVRVVLRGTGY